MTGEGSERVAWISQALSTNDLDALICVLPSNVLLLSRYWPVVGTSVAVASASGVVGVLAPEDEAELARSGWADNVKTYAPGSLANLDGPEQTAPQPLGDLLKQLGLTEGNVGVEAGSMYEESSYSATYRFHKGIEKVVQSAMPGLRLQNAHEVLCGLRSRLSGFEVREVAIACELAESAFVAARSAIHPGAREPDVATALASTMERQGLKEGDVARAGAFAWCMSGSNSAEAGGAYARTRNRSFHQGDLILVHSNPYVDGYFTDITRTYVLGRPDQQLARMYAAVFDAREAALSAIRPDVPARDVDAAARQVLDRAGFGQYFTHGVGHNVGFSAISADFPPRLHPASPDILGLGSTFNIEPAIYIPGYGGIRHCDVVTVTSDGYRLLTPFQSSLVDLIIDEP